MVNPIPFFNNRIAYLMYKVLCSTAGAEAAEGVQVACTREHGSLRYRHCGSFPQGKAQVQLSMYKNKPTHYINPAFLFIALFIPLRYFFATSFHLQS